MRGDVEIEAAAAARELRALDRPRTGMRVTGSRVRKEDVSARENLPERLEPGELNRHVRVRRRIAGRLTDSGEQR